MPFRRACSLAFYCALMLGLLLTLGADRAHAQERLNIAPPPAGSLSQSQLDHIAADIRRLETNPFAPDVQEANRTLLQWLTGSPDISVSVCPGFITQLDDGYAFKPTIMMQHIFSMAAFKIEHPDQADDERAVQQAGIEGALTTYDVIRASGQHGASNDFLDSLLRARDQHTFTDEIAPLVDDC